jgi:hypothetical protein
LLQIQKYFSNIKQHQILYQVNEFGGTEMSNLQSLFDNKHSWALKRRDEVSANHAEKNFPSIDLVISPEKPSGGFVSADQSI